MLSMTGFGRFEKSCDNGHAVSVEVSSINRKQLELRIALPGELAQFEPEVRNLASKFFSRGAVSIRVNLKKALHSAGELALPEPEKFDALIRYVAEARLRNGIKSEVNVEALLALPGVMTSEQISADDPEIKQLLLSAVENACASCREMRSSEGDALKRDFESRIDMLESLLGQITEKLPEIVESAKARLLEKISALKIELDPCDSAFLREVVYLTDKSDVTEEVVRLKSHFVQFRNYLQKTEPCGRNLDFLAQEMVREINTLCNKSGNSSISPSVVIFKTELEKIREQIQNVE